ncbi:MAG TPA: hypothetical protein ENI33_09375 [Thermoplasmatales archaeon]|nr:hypothetical protein [Thermoplasmatales archaeon]
MKVKVGTFVMLSILIYFLIWSGNNQEIFIPKSIASKVSPPIIINKGVRAINESYWINENSTPDGIIEIKNDFLNVKHIEWANKTAFEIRDFEKNILYEINYSSWRIGNESLYNYNKTVYFYDWASQEWKIWQKGYAMPDFEKPYFKQVFKWKVEMQKNGISVNITFYMTSHDPFLRIFVDANEDIDLSILPKTMKRLGTTANYSDNKLLNWNQKTSRLHGNHWSGAAWSDCEQGFVGQNYIRTYGVEIHKLTDYYSNLNSYVQGHAYGFFNWQHNKSDNWYSYEFYIDNENENDVNATIETFIPDEIIKVEFYNFYSTSNSSAPTYKLIGEWNKKNYGEVKYFNDSKNTSHTIKVYKPLNRTESWDDITASDKFGVLKRLVFKLSLTSDEDNDSESKYYNDQLRIKIKIYYAGDGTSTYLFSNDDHRFYGLLNALSPYILLYNYSINDKPIFISSNFSDCLLYVKSDENEDIKEVGFFTNGSFVFSLGYNGKIDSTIDEGENGVPDIFEKNGWEWSEENLSFISSSSLNHYDILDWNYSIENELIINNVSVEWHGKNKIFGCGVPHSINGNIVTDRIINGVDHIIAFVNDTVNFSISYNASKYVYEDYYMDFGLKNFNISLNFETDLGTPYTAKTIVYFRNIMRRIYREDEIPEGKRNMPNESEWIFNFYRNGVNDNENWDKDYEGDIFKRIDNFSCVNYSIKVKINPIVEVSINYEDMIGINNVSLAFDFGYWWDKYINSSMAVNKSKETNFSMARIHLRTLYRDSSWYPHTPCIQWDPINHTAIEYNWTMLDYWLNEVVNNWSLTPMMSVGGSKTLAIPKEMPYEIIGGNGGEEKILPNATDFAQYFADVTKHIAVDMNITPIYLEVMNEPYIPNDAVAIKYMNLYNTVRQKVNETLTPYEKKLGSDIYLGINYIDIGYGWPGGLSEPFYNFVYNLTQDDLEFGSIHKYPGGWGHCFSSQFHNKDFIFFPPNNKYGWFTDERAINRTYYYTAVHGNDPRITFKEMHERWKEKFGHKLMLFNTEGNFNSQYKNGSDPRQQNVISAILHAIMLKNYALNNFSYYTFFTLASMHTQSSPMYKYGDRGFAIMNWSEPHEPFAPYFVAYLWGKYFSRRCEVCNFTISKNYIDLLPVKMNNSYRIWIINKVDSNITVNFNFTGVDIKNVTMVVLDQNGYIQKYDSQLNKTIIEKRELHKHYLNPDNISFTFNGYSVAVMGIGTMPSIDYISIVHKTENEIFDCNISTNFSFIAYASAFNNTYGFIDFIDANWSIVNYASNASINATHGKSILFNSGWNDGTAILTAEYNGHNDSVVFNINSSLFSFMLYKGWNLITLPCENSYNASSLFNDIEGCSIILGWNANVQNFIIYVPGSPYDFAIENGKGYFIGMSHDSIFSLADVPVENVSIPLHIGWNILGWFNSWQTNASSLYNAIQGCTLVLKWNASMQDFDLYAPGVPNDFVVTRGDGFLVAVSEQSTWHGER